MSGRVVRECPDPRREAERIGLVNRSLPAEKLLETAMERARKIAGKGPIGMALTEQLIWGTCRPGSARAPPRNAAPA